MSAEANVLVRQASVYFKVKKTIIYILYDLLWKIYDQKQTRCFLLHKDTISVHSKANFSMHCFHLIIQILNDSIDILAIFKIKLEAMDQNFVTDTNNIGNEVLLSFSLVH